MPEVPAGAPGPDARLASLERSVRWLRAMVVLLCVGLALLLVWQLAPRSPVVEAHGFVLRDRHWRSRGALTLLDHDTPALRLNTPDGRARLLMLARDNGSVSVRFRDLSDHDRLALDMAPDGTPRVVFTGRDVLQRVWLGVTPGGDGRLALVDSSHAHVWRAP